MTVQELIAELSKLPPDATVKVYQPVEDIETDEVFVHREDDGSILIDSQPPWP